MKYRWFIRSIFMLPILLCIIGCATSATAPSTAPTTQPEEARPEDAAQAAIDAFGHETSAIRANLPGSLTDAQGEQYYIGLVEAIGDLKSPAAKVFARRLADVLAQNKFKLSDTLVKLPAIPKNSGRQPPIGRADNVRLYVLAGAMVNDAPWKDLGRKEFQRYRQMMFQAAEVRAYYSPSAADRFVAADVMSQTEEELQECGDDDENPARMWIAPAKLAKSFDNAFGFVLDPANGEGGRKLDPGAAFILRMFDGEVLSPYLVVHALATDTPGGDVLTGPLGQLGGMARKALRTATDPADRQILTWFIGHLEQLKHRAAGMPTECCRARPAVTKLIADFVDAVNANDQKTWATLLTPEGRGNASTIAGSPRALFHGPVRDIRVFFVHVPQPKLNTDAQHDGNYWFHVYLQATDLKDQHPRYARARITVRKDAGRWRINDIGWWPTGRTFAIVRVPDHGSR